MHRVTTPKQFVVDLVSFYISLVQAIESIYDFSCGLFAKGVELIEVFSGALMNANLLHKPFLNPIILKDSSVPTDMRLVILLFSCSKVLDKEGQLEIKIE